MPHRLLPPLLASLALLVAVNAHAASPQIVLEQSRQTREAFIETFRRTGEREFGRLDAAEAMLRTAIDDPESAEAAPELLFELGSVIRLAFRFTDAIPTLEKAAAAAEAAGRRDLAFDAWLDVARSHFLGTRDHGAADSAFEKAVLVAGDTPSERQRFQIASYRTALLSARNDVEAGFAAAAEALRTAQTPEDRFYAHFDLAGLFRQVAESCDYVPSFEDCRRAVDAAVREHSTAAGIARAAGWTALAGQAEDAARDLGLRRLVIDHWEYMEKMAAPPEMFAPRVATDVLVHNDFSSSLVGDDEAQEALEAIAQEGSAYGLVPQRDARSLFLAGLAMDLGGDEEEASQLYVDAVRRLEEERGSLFDPRRRGTVIENRAEFYSKAALRLLHLGRPEPAFEILERARARGLAELLALGEQGDLGPTELSFLSELLRLEAIASKAQKALKERAVQAGALDPNDPSLDEVLKLEKDRLALLRRRPEIVMKLAGAAWSPVRLPELQAKAAMAGTSVLLYWTQRDKLVVWHVGPGGSNVRAVFLPRSVLREKVERLRGSAERSSERFDAEAARELYLFLIAPMKPQLSSERIMIVPHGELLGLPFETLIDPETGRYLIEEFEVLYAPNGSYAARALTAPLVRPERAVAVVDQTINIETEEIDGMRAGLGGDKVREVDRDQLTSPALKAFLAGADTVHLLVHGEFNGDEPLLSTLDLGLVDRLRKEFYATDLLDLPISQARLAVFSACESGAIKSTIANEIYGIPWVLLVGGVPTVVLSRWRVDAEATGRWMGRFYRALEHSGSPGHAVAAAMRDQLAEPATAHPYFWAGPQITGR